MNHLCENVLVCKNKIKKSGYYAKKNIKLIRSESHKIHEKLIEVKGRQKNSLIQSIYREKCLLPSFFPFDIHALLSIAPSKIPISDLSGQRDYFKRNWLIFPSSWYGAQ